MEKESFESKMQELEKIVCELEKGDKNLDESMKKFEQGMILSKQCSKMLDEAEQKITILIENNGNFEEENFIVEEK